MPSNELAKRNGGVVDIKLTLSKLVLPAKARELISVTKLGIVTSAKALFSKALFPIIFNLLESVTC